MNFKDGNHEFSIDAQRQQSQSCFVFFGLFRSPTGHIVERTATKIGQ